MKSDRLTCSMFCLIPVLLIIGTLSAYAYDSTNLVGSALGYEVDSKTFMMYFQDGNILSLIVGVVCAIALLLFRKRISSKFKISLSVFVITLIVLPLLMMLMGRGYNGAILAIISLAYGFFILVFVGVLILLTKWVIMIIKTNFKQASVEILKKVLNVIVIVFVPVICALFTFGICDAEASSWNQAQCEKYVQERWSNDFTKVPALMYEWEESHSLQWGDNMAQYYQRRHRN